jgi:16S rRNA C1402 (ribose-2'-O) methylase RsmI
MVPGTKRQCAGKFGVPHIADPGLKGVIEGNPENTGTVILPGVHAPDRMGMDAIA